MLLNINILIIILIVKLINLKRAKTNIQFHTPDEVEKLFTALTQEPIKYQPIIMLALNLRYKHGDLTSLLGKIYILKLVKLKLIKLLNMLIARFLKKILKLNISKE